MFHKSGLFKSISTYDGRYLVCKDKDNTAIVDRQNKIVVKNEVFNVVTDYMKYFRVYKKINDCLMSNLLSKETQEYFFDKFYQDFTIIGENKSFVLQNDKWGVYRGDDTEFLYDDISKYFDGSEKYNKEWTEVIVGDKVNWVNDDTGLLLSPNIWFNDSYRVVTIDNFGDVIFWDNGASWKNGGHGVYEPMAIDMNGNLLPQNIMQQIK